MHIRILHDLTLLVFNWADSERVRVTPQPFSAGDILAVGEFLPVAEGTTYFELRGVGVAELPAGAWQWASPARSPEDTPEGVGAGRAPKGLAARPAWPTGAHGRS